MRLSLGLETRQTLQQKQVLAPRMIQSMEILQLPMMALLEKIDQALNENPALELQEFEPEPVEGAPVELESPDSPTVEEKELVVDENRDNVDDFERLICKVQ